MKKPSWLVSWKVLTLFMIQMTAIYDVTAWTSLYFLSSLGDALQGHPDLNGTPQPLGFNKLLWS